MRHKIIIQVRLFTLVVFALGIALSLFIWLTGGHNSPFIAWSYTSMLIPALAVLILVALFKVPPLSIQWSIFPVRWLPVALLLLPVILHIVLLPIYAHFSTAIYWQLWPTILLNMMFGLLIVSILAFFEEIGWRAWLLPKLMRVMGIRPALFLAALLCALWHTPYDFSGIHYIGGVKVPVQATMNVFGEFGAALVFGWLWVRTQSIGVVCLAHGALNNWGQLAFKYLPDLPPGDDMNWLLASLDGALFITGMTVLLSIKSGSTVNHT
jgi:membrane protease YdiL (CAAX protease family)